MSAPDPLRGVAAVSFDVDGTLYSTRGLRRRVLGEAVRRARELRSRAPLRDLRDLARFRRRAAAARKEGGFLDDGWAIRIAARLEAEERLLLPVLRRLGPAPGLIGLMEVLRFRVGRLIAVSDFVAEAKIETLGLEGRFERCYAGEEIGVIKPNPAIFRQALADLRIAPGALLHLGDRSETDGAAAGAAGCRALIRGRDFRSFGDLIATL